MDSDTATAHILDADPAFTAVMQATGPFTPRSPDADPFNSLARAIVFQQLAGPAARAIHGRFTALFDGHPTAEAILQTPIEQLRTVGLSGNKATSIADLALKTTDGTVPLNRLDEISDAEIVQRLSTVRGIGRWTAEMFLIFQLRRLDVWPVGDLGVRHGYGLAWQVPTPTARELGPLGEPFRPYRSVAAWYCWRAAELYAGAADSALTGS